VVQSLRVSSPASAVVARPVITFPDLRDAALRHLIQGVVLLTNDGRINDSAVF
jgi:hypothetical protein